MQRTKDRTGKRHRVKSSQRPRERTDVMFRLLILLGLFALAFYGINAKWTWLRHVEVSGAVTYTDDEIIALAGLDGLDGLWTIAVPVETICESLEKNPLIERAEILYSGINSFKIKVTERRGVAAVNQGGFQLVFDRTGELIYILRPEEFCPVPEVRGVPPGLLKFGGEPLHMQGDAWRLPENSAPPDIMETQFDRLIQLRYFLDRYTPGRDGFLDLIFMDEEGSLTVEYQGCPPVLLGKFDSPEIQVRRLIAALNDEFLMNTERTRDIDLSSVLFPCYHVNDGYLTRDEQWLIDQLDEARETDAGETGERVESDEEGDNVDAESVEGDSRDDANNDESGIIGDRIFDLGNGG